MGEMNLGTCKEEPPGKEGCPEIATDQFVLGIAREAEGFGVAMQDDAIDGKMNDHERQTLIKFSKKLRGGRLHGLSEGVTRELRR